MKPFVPPLNFAQVLPLVYRSGYPNDKNFEFLASLELKSILYLSPVSKETSQFSTWATEQGIITHRSSFRSIKDPFEEIDTEQVKFALELILDSSNHPILFHDNKGRHLASLITFLLRRLSNWSYTFALSEYRQFLPEEKLWKETDVGKPEPGRERERDLQFIDLFDLSSVEMNERSIIKRDSS